MTTLETFTKAKDALLEEYKTKEKELASMRKELVKLGVLQDEVSAPEVAPKARKARRTRVTLDEAAVTKFLGDKELSYKDVAGQFGCSPQSAKKLLDTSKKFTSRKEDPKNPKSKIYYKVKH